VDIWHVLLSYSLLLSLVYGQVWRWFCRETINAEGEAIKIAWEFREQLENCQVLAVELASKNHILRNKADKYDLIISDKKEGN
jgi:hypothetical protein